MKMTYNDIFNSTGYIHTLHGVSSNYNAAAQSCRNYIPTNLFEVFLDSIDWKYSSWKNFSNKTNVLTIDDSTYGGAEACLLARKKGHEVIYFINPCQIQSNASYFFCLLDLYLDSKTVNDIYFNSKKFSLANNRELKKFRKEVKNIAMSLSAENAVEFIKNDVFKILKCSENHMPEHLKTIGIEQLINLEKSGVIIQSHGWSHKNISSFSASEFETDIEMTNNWLRINFDIDPLMYAVPFGFPDIPEKVKESFAMTYFLVDDDLPNGQLSSICWNRIDITNCFKKI